MKKILAVLLALIMVLGVTSAFADEMKKPLKVGVTIYQFNDNFMTLYRTELQKYLEETYGAQVTVVDGKNDQTEQTNQINSFIADGVDVLIINMVQATSSAAVTELAKEAGIPVIYDNTMGPSDVDYLTYVGVDNAEVGRMIAEEMAAQIDYKGKVLVMEGVPGQATSDVRTKAAMDVFASYPDITVESGVTSWQTDEGRKLAEDYITKWGNELKAIVAVGGNQAEGAVEAVKAAGMQGEILVSGFDVQEPQYLAVANGDEIFTVSQGVYQQSYLSVVAAIRALNGESVPRQINCPITIVDKDNLDSMDERPAALQNR